MSNEIINIYGKVPVIDFSLLKSNNYLINYCQRSDELKLLLDTMWHAVKQLNGFYPRLVHYTHDTNVYRKCMQVLQTAKTDQEFIDQSSLEFYKSVVLCLYTANVSFIKRYVINLVDADQYEVVYADDASLPKTIFLYHGSPMYNWYSILRNGLIAASSENNLMINGAAFGNGIYMARHACTALHYANRRICGKIIMGVYEVDSMYAKTMEKKTGIYVFPDNRQLKLKYFILFGKSHKLQLDQYGNIIDQYFNSINQTMTDIQHTMQATGLNRLHKEIARTSNVTILNDNIQIWYIDIRISEEDSKTLFAELSANSIYAIRLEVRFPPRYPFDPPFVRIVSPRFKYLTGHITVGGSICMDILSKKNWTASVSIENLMMQIKVLILEGNATLDTNWMKPYSLEDAKQSFTRTMHTHGWL